MERILGFLSDLKNNNNREWFQEHKEAYHQLKLSFENIIGEVILFMSSVDKEIGLLQPEDCLFRIYRDVRFSKNKDPYKTAMGAYFAKGGKKSRFAGYYLHIEPEKSFIGGGLWQPQTDVLKSVRKEIYYNSEEFKNIIKNSEFERVFGKLMEEKLKKPPKDFPSDFKDIELLLYKSYVVGHAVSDEFLIKNGVAETVFGIFKVMKTYIDFLNRAIESQEL
jgi:uncharacterized protein (TIGR02453 family)